MGRITKRIKWIFAGLVAIAAAIGLTCGRSRTARKIGEAEGRAEADHAVVQKERERTSGESTEDLYKDLTNGGK